MHGFMAPTNCMANIVFVLLGANPLDQKVSNAPEGSWLKRQWLFLGVSMSKETPMVCAFACIY
jgi:hypothetical protein